MHYQNHNRHKQAKQRKNCDSVPASCIGGPFFNPYTFIPFSSESLTRREPTPLTADETEYRFTGLMRLKIRNLSPLMSCSPIPVNPTAGHKEYKALTSGDDVIVPATAVKGALRNLITIIRGAALENLDDYQYLCQGRDLNLGGKAKELFIGLVCEHITRLQLGETRLVDLDELKKTAGMCRIRLERPAQGKKINQYWTSEPKVITLTRKFYQRENGRVNRKVIETRDVPVTVVDSISTKKDSRHQWMLKMSGRPAGREEASVDNYKKEGLFLPSGKTVQLPEELKMSYNSRNAHGSFSEVKDGMLLWLEVPEGKEKITSADDIQSLQWARWGKKGINIKKLLDVNVFPDSIMEDGKVDIVADLFGQIPRQEKAACPFAARIRPENLVFPDGKHHLEKETLAPLAQPHPGCLAFYRECDDIDALNYKTAKMRGYKVYRNTLERGENAPWKFNVQGIYKNGKLLDPKQKVNKTAELLKEGMDGYLNISLRSLSLDELALVFAVCTVDWKIGGGRPLGLGHCKVMELEILNEDMNVVYRTSSSDGESLKIDDSCFEVITEEWEETGDTSFSSLIEDYKKRLELYKLSQKPVPFLRYPRAAEANRNQDNRGGHIWFMRHAAPKKNGGKGLEVLLVGGELEKKAKKDSVKAQVLPEIGSDDEQLYGYDMLPEVEKVRRQNIVMKLEKYKERDRKIDPASKNTSNNAESRKRQKGIDRKDEG